MLSAQMRVIYLRFSLQAVGGLERYAVADQVGEGQFGVVSRAMDKRTGEMVAIKELKYELETQGFDIRALRELMVLAKIQRLSQGCKNLVGIREILASGKHLKKWFVKKTVLDALRYLRVVQRFALQLRLAVTSTPIVRCGARYLVMEYCDLDLGQVLEYSKDSPLRPAQVKDAMRQLFTGLKVMHEHNFIHRDIKSINCLVSANGILKLCDFGCARQYGQFAGTWVCCSQQPGNA